MWAALRLFFLLSLFALPARSEQAWLLLSDNSAPYAEFESTLRDTLADSRWRLTISHVAGSADTPRPQADLIIAAGAQALRTVLAQNPSQPVLATLLPRQSFERLSAEFAGKLPRRLSAIWLDQPLVRQASFLRHLLPDHRRIGVLLSPETRNQQIALQRALSTANLSLDIEETDGERSLMPALGTLLPKVQVLLALPDTAIYRRDNIKPILMTTYRHQRPLVAFSAAFVSAGALAALYSTPAQIARQTADILQQPGSALPPPGSPTLFSISLNSTVAQSLDLKLSDEASLRRALLSEREPK